MGEILQAILAITLIDLAMSGDNALVIGMVARGLPRAQRRKAIVFGAGAAVAIRVAAAAAVAALLTLPYPQVHRGGFACAGSGAVLPPAARRSRPRRAVATAP